MVLADKGSETRRILFDGLWHRNAGLVQMLGLCPLLAVSNTVVNGLGLALATAFVLILTNAAVSLLRRLLVDALRLPMFVLIIASLVTVVELVLQGFFPELDRRLGIFVPLIVTNCTILARAERFASREPLGRSVLDGAATGAGFGAVLLALGALRELVGQGTLFAGMDQLLGEWAATLSLELLPGGLLLAALPPGAFIGLGLLVALHRARSGRRGETAPAADAPGRTGEPEHA